MLYNLGMVLTSQRAVEAIECSVNEFISKEGEKICVRQPHST